MNFQDHFERRTKRVQQNLNRYLPPSTVQPKNVFEAMRYSVIDGGKRVRPLLVYACGEAFGVPLSQLDIPAVAVELVHAYSLIHDDLPAMDNDDYRRGKLSCHRAFGEATAILAGDALQALAYHLLAQREGFDVPPEQKLLMIEHLSHACGPTEMVAGQALEFNFADRPLNENELEIIHRKKTGALIEASVHLGCLAAHHYKDLPLRKMLRFGQALGFAYQLQDDLADFQSGQDRDKTTNFAVIVGEEATAHKIQSLITAALHEISGLDERADPLRELCSLWFPAAVPTAVA